MKQDKEKAKQIVHELYNDLQTNSAPGIADVSEVLLRVYSKTDRLKDLAPTYNRLVTYIYFTGKVNRFVLTQRQETLVAKLATIGNSAGVRGAAYGSDYGDKLQF
ncbi:bacteriocin immunity protein [Loigolactobacillus iwatensis]|uniref:bacteriocin immunity protein n=1 Tax=Loigolactobacillus iwatensis TaxID=1267156 RepID=UPI000F7E5E37|nr:bacteriocin immunity protein [Loigolactobacillus iwatensis]